MTPNDPTTWFDGIERLLFVHAHPDDETLATGGVLAGLAAAGREPALVTLTRGEQGEVVEGPFASLQGTASLARHREAELAHALAMLGVERHAFLGTPPARAEGLEPRAYEDSGMQWGDDGFAIAGETSSQLALTRANAFEPIKDLLTAAEAWGVRGVVSYDERGGYGHPDHVFAHRIARAVAHGLEIPFWEVIDFEMSPASALESAEDVYDITPWLERRTAALRSHGTQMTVVSDTEVVHVGGQPMTLPIVERFRKLTLPEG